MNWKKIFRRGSGKKTISEEEPSLAHSLAKGSNPNSTKLQVSTEAHSPTRQKQDSDPIESGYASPETGWSAEQQNAETTTTVQTSTTAAPRIDETLDEESRDKEQALLQAWRKNTEPKMLPIPSDYPDYMRDQPKIHFAETETYLKRKKANLKRIESRSLPAFEKNQDKIKPGPKPKLNKTFELRKGYAKKEPILSQHFQQHFEAYRRAPFQTSKLKLSTT